MASMLRHATFIAGNVPDAGDMVMRFLSLDLGGFFKAMSRYTFQL